MRTKAAYLRLDDPAIWFDFYLARELGMTVAQLRATMPNDEYVMWGMYFAKKQQDEELARLKQGS